MKKCLGFVIAAVVAITASADALYWQVDTAAADAAYKGTFTYAELYAVANGSLNNPTSLAVVDSYSQTGTGTLPTLTNLGSYGASGYSFYVELFNYNDQTQVSTSVHKQYVSTYDNLVTSGYISQGGLKEMAAMQTAGFTPFNGASIPEPTSGLLLLVGCGLLGLRRRRSV